MVHALLSSTSIMSLCGRGITSLRPAPEGAKVDCERCVAQLDEVAEFLIDGAMIPAADDGGAPGEDILE